MGRRFRKLTLVLLIFLLFLNTVLLLRNVDLSLPVRTSEINQARESSKVLVTYYRTLLETAGLKDSQLQNRITGVMNGINESRSLSQLVVVINQAVDIPQEITAKKNQVDRRFILDSLNKDPGVRATRKDEVAIRFSVDPLTGGLSIVEPNPVLSEDTKTVLRNNPKLVQFNQAFDVIISNGQASLLTTEDPESQLLSLRLESDDLRRAVGVMHKAAAMTRLSGPGVVVKASDAPGGYLWSEIVHERDIRDVVNSLFQAGAEGVQIGNMRLGAASWVRCVGPVVVVNGEAVAANPIIVRAVGEQDALADSVRPLQEIFATTGKRLTVEKLDSLTLSPIEVGVRRGGT